MSNHNPEILNFYAPSNKETFKGILSIPHSGMLIPSEFIDFMSDNQYEVNRDCDYKVHELIDIEKLNTNGVAVLVSNIHRTCVDLNRSSDLAVFNWRKNSVGFQIIVKEPDQNFFEKALRNYYFPYYEVLDSTIDELIRLQKKPASIIDLHSMPSKATDFHLNYNPNQKVERPNFCLSDISGISCDKNYIDFITSKFKNHFENITNNDPYFGGFVTKYIQEKYKEKVNNIQIEINRALYMDEKEQSLITDTKKFNLFKENLTNILIESFIHFDS